MLVLIADKFEQSGCDGLQAVGCDVSYQPDLKDDTLVEAIRGEQPDVLVVRGTRVTERCLKRGRKVSRARSAGYNTIGRGRPRPRRGIYVSNCPGKNSIAVANWPLLILALDRRVVDNVSPCGGASVNKKEFQRPAGSTAGCWVDRPGKMVRK